MTTSLCPHCGGMWTACCHEVARLTLELAPFQPMSSEEAEAAMDAIEAEPMTPQEIDDVVKYATDAEYRAEYLGQRYVEALQIARGLRAENERLRSKLASGVECWALKDHPDRPGDGCTFDPVVAHQWASQSIDKTVVHGLFIPTETAEPMPPEQVERLSHSVINQPLFSCVDCGNPMLAERDGYGKPTGLAVCENGHKATIGNRGCA